MATTKTNRTTSRKPAQRWRDLHLDAFEGFRHSVDFTRLSEEGLRALGCAFRLSTKEFEEVVTSLDDRTEWGKFIARCNEVGAAYGLDPRTVLRASVVKGYRPDIEGEEHFDHAFRRAELVIVTDLDADLGSPFFTNLLGRASELGLPVQTRSVLFLPGGGGTMVRADGVPTTFALWEWVELTNDQRPPLSTAFRVRVEFPPRFLSESACERARGAIQAQNELARRLGYRVPRRTRRRSIARRG
jgi:hypothetical protein